jgi:hypothetical protein
MLAFAGFVISAVIPYFKFWRDLLVGFSGWYNILQGYYALYQCDTAMYLMIPA